jgi:gamma-glutamyltranspeptidase/glutathione hydrolase
MTNAAIAADSKLTAAAGARIARQGGNAVDIAVGAAMAATVAEVLMCSLGGSGFFMVQMPGKPAELIEGADARPAIHELPKKNSSAWREVHLPYGDGTDVMAGPASVAVPGVLAAAEQTWKRHGSLPWSEVVAPALELASRKIPTSSTQSVWLALAGHLLLDQQQACRDSFFVDGKPLQLNQEHQIPNLDRTWEAISREGADALYRGDLSASFAREICDHGGFVSREDLAAYQAQVRKPVSIESGGFRLALNPPPAVGGSAVGFLIKSIESKWQDCGNPAEKARVNALAQLQLLTMRQQELADPDFDSEQAEELLQTALSGGPGPLQSPNTTHLSVATSDGGLVAVTMSTGYGSGIVIPELGIDCNNALGEPELNPRGFYRGKPGSRISSNMAPTLARHPDGRCLAMGSPGASRITTAIAQTWLRVVLEGMSYEEAVAAPRLHIESFADELRAQFEPGIDTSQLGEPLVQRAFDGTNWYFGAVKLAGLDQQGQLHAVADTRREGAVEFV